MRRQSVAFFLGDVGFIADPKFRKLARRLVDPDDFNSAVGAYFIALAAARRNGLPELDVIAETDSRFIDDLEAVGLLTTSGFPEKAFVSWKPSRTPYPGEVSRDARTVTNSTKDNDSHGTHVPSTPFSSTPINSKNEQDAREDFDALDRFYELTGWNPWTLDWRREELVALQNDYGIPATIAALDAEWSANHDKKGLTKGAAARLARDTDRAKEAARAERKAKPKLVPLDDAERARIAWELQQETTA